MDATSTIISATGVLGTLAGVSMGSWFSGRNERWRLFESQRREDRQARVNICIEYLTVYRHLRTYVLANDITVVLQPGIVPGNEAAFIKDATEMTENIQRVTGHLRLLEGGPTPIHVAAGQVQEACRQLLLARARQPSGPLPAEIVENTREAERDFVRIAHRALNLS